MYYDFCDLMQKSMCVFTAVLTTGRELSVVGAITKDGHMYVLEDLPLDGAEIIHNKKHYTAVKCNTNFNDVFAYTLKGGIPE